MCGHLTSIAIAAHARQPLSRAYFNHLPPCPAAP